MKPKMKKLDLDHLRTEDISNALEFLLKKYRGVGYGRYSSDRYDLLWKGIAFPPKLVIVTAAAINGQKPIGHLEFSGGEGSGRANEFLRRFAKELGYRVGPKKKGSERSLSPAITNDIRQRTFLLTWNPSKYARSEVERRHEEFESTGALTLEWSCGRTKSIRSGDRVFLMKLGKPGPKGIFISGRVLASPTKKLRQHKSLSSSGETNFVRFHVESFVLPSEEEKTPGFIDLDTLKGISPKFHWTPQGSGIEIPKETATELAGLVKPLIQSAEKVQSDRERVVASVTEAFDDVPLTFTEKEAIVKLRVGQGDFRNQVKKIEKGCRVTGVSDESVLIASHIKPWSKCSSKERLDEHNGLFLTPNVDKLFDRGMISFSDDGKILFKPKLRPLLKALGINPDMNVGKFKAKQCEFLAWHRRASGLED